MRGPIDYIIIKFNEPKFEGDILQELATASSAGTIAVLALSAVHKAVDGRVSRLDITEDELIFETASPVDNTLISDEDIQEVGELLEPGSAAGLLIIEQLWAKGLKQAIQDAGGSLIAEGRIHPEAASELEN